MVEIADRCGLAVPGQWAACHGTAGAETASPLAVRAVSLSETKAELVSTGLFYRLASRPMMAQALIPALHHLASHPPSPRAGRRLHHLMVENADLGTSVVSSDGFREEQRSFGHCPIGSVGPSLGFDGGSGRIASAD